MLIERFIHHLPAWAKQPTTILDLGSLDGKQAIEFATLFPSAKVYAFEANPKSAARAKENVRDWLRIEVIYAAVHNLDGVVKFHPVDDSNPGASSLFHASGHMDVQPINQTEIAVPSVRLETWAESRRIDRFDLVWMDLQGAELLALQGMGHLLDTIKAIQLEITYRELYHGQVMWPELRGFLESWKFRLVDEWPDACGYFGDAVFVNRACPDR